MSKVLAFKNEELNLQQLITRLWELGNWDILDGFTAGAALHEPNRETSEELFFLNELIQIRKKL